MMTDEERMEAAMQLECYVNMVAWIYRNDGEEFGKQYPLVGYNAEEVTWVIDYVNLTLYCDPRFEPVNHTSLENTILYGLVTDAMIAFSHVIPDFTRQRLTRRYAAFKMASDSRFQEEAL